MWVAFLYAALWRDWSLFDLWQADSLQCYSTYCRNQSYATKFLQKKREDDQWFEVFLKVQSADLRKPTPCAWCHLRVDGPNKIRVSFTGPFSLFAGACAAHHKIPPPSASGIVCRFKLPWYRLTVCPRFWTVRLKSILTMPLWDLHCLLLKECWRMWTKRLDALRTFRKCLNYPESSTWKQQA